MAALVALYPAYVIQDNCRQSTPDPENIPDTLYLMGTEIGGIYNHDAMSFDIYEVMANYPVKCVIGIDAHDPEDLVRLSDVENAFCELEDLHLDFVKEIHFR